MEDRRVEAVFTAVDMPVLGQGRQGPLVRATDPHARRCRGIAGGTSYRISGYGACIQCTSRQAGGRWWSRVAEGVKAQMQASRGAGFGYSNFEPAVAAGSSRDRQPHLPARMANQRRGAAGDAGRTWRALATARLAAQLEAAASDGSPPNCPQHHRDMAQIWRHPRSSPAVRLCHPVNKSRLCCGPCVASVPVPVPVPVVPRSSLPLRARCTPMRRQRPR